MKYPSHYYTEFDFFEDRDMEIRSHLKRIVTTRKDHQCCLGQDSQLNHNIAKGSLAVLESGIFDNEWVSSYFCLSCADRELDKFYLESEDRTEEN